MHAEACRCRAVAAHARQRSKQRTASAWTDSITRLLAHVQAVASSSRWHIDAGYT